MEEHTDYSGESDPEGCAACSAAQNPQNGYRNGPLYASYTAETLYNIYALAKREGVNFRAEVNWSFEFEDQPVLCGFSRNGFEWIGQASSECVSNVWNAGPAAGAS